jgi:hypothetical protein
VAIASLSSVTAVGMPSAASRSPSYSGMPLMFQRMSSDPSGTMAEAAFRSMVL